VEEPQEEQAIIMMRGIVKSLEKHHGLEILEEGIEDAVRLSRRYITGRQLPDKAVSILDTAAARVAIGHAAVPAPIEDARRDIDHLTLQIDILNREMNAGADHSERIAELESRKQDVSDRLEKLENRWTKERDLVQQIREIRKQLATGVKSASTIEQAIEAASGEETAADSEKTAEQETVELTDQKKETLRTDLIKLNATLEEIQGENPLMQVCVDSQTIAEVISGWTGIPVGKMLTDEIRMISSLKERMGKRIVGQSHALEAISRRIQTARANLVDPRRPVGVFMLVGPSGVGKTETALTLADIMYGGERNMVTINMSEYQEAHTVSSLKGSPPGYVGYGEGGVLTEAVRRKPYCVVLLDEVEKAHSDVIELFYQVFDKGILEDAEGRVIDFKNTLILLTSNVGTDTIQKLCADPETLPDSETLAQALRPDLLNAFPPAFLGRLTIVPYFSLSDDVMQQIIYLQLGHVANRLKKNHRAELVYDEAVVTQILSRCQETESGARNVDHILTGTLLPEISREILSRMGAEEPIARVQISVGEDGGFAYQIT
jgi:type VI secretion system protein VasG